MDAAAWYREGVHHAERFRFEEARKALERAVELGAGADALAVLSAVRGELGDIDGAARDLERARVLAPDDPSIALLDATLLPMAYHDAANLEHWRNRYTQRLDDFARNLERYRPNAARVLGLARPNFLLAYQGRDDVVLQRHLGECLTALLRDASPQYFEPLQRAVRPRLRVGFASAFLFDCTIGRYFASWIEGLDRKRFEVMGFMTGAAGDAYTERLGRSCLSMQVVNAPVLEVAQRIREAQLDVLIYPEVGMDPRARLLSCMRLAPVQLAAWGHPQTTGSPEIDAFISCEEMEAPGSEAHYTEKRILLPGLGVSYDPPPVPPPFTREALRFEPGRPVYCCPHSLFKLHPDSDALLADILAHDPDGVLVLFQGQNSGVGPGRITTERISRALDERGVPARRQLRLLPRLSPTDFRRAIQAADVIVDPLHWSGGNTALDTLAAGTPVVTVPGPLMRSRQAAAMLRRLDASECIAATAAEAATLAVRIAREAGLRDALRSRLSANAGRLFRDGAPVARLAEHLASLVH